MRAHPGVLFMIDGIGLRPRIEEMADRIAAQGYVVLAPNAFYGAGALRYGKRLISRILTLAPSSFGHSVR